MNELYNYLQAEYIKTNWEYFNIVNISKLFPDLEEQSEFLISRDIIKKRPGVNSDLFQLNLDYFSKLSL